MSVERRRKANKMARKKSKTTADDSQIAITPESTTGSPSANVVADSATFVQDQATLQEVIDIPEEKLVIKEEKKAAPPVEEKPVTVQKLIYQNAGDQMITLYHLYPNRTPVYYGNGRKKVFNKFGEKWSISVREFEQEFAPTPVAEMLLKQKTLVLGSDCPDEVRERLDIDYTDGKLITPEVYKILLGLNTDEVCQLFEDVCIEHKQLMVQIFCDDLEATKGQHCQREKIKALNDISKKYVEAGKPGMFASLLKAISAIEEEHF